MNSTECFDIIRAMCPESLRRPAGFRSMPSRQRGSRFFILLLLLSGWLLVCRAAFAQEGCASAACHATLLKAKNVHPATESCESCHESVATPHPQKGTKTFKLTEEPPALCFACHGDIQDLLKKKDVHPAMEAGCTACHDPHGAAHPKLLAEEGAKLCFQCHDAIGSKIEKGPAVHAAVKEGKGCISCHDAHGADGAHLLPGSEEATCLGCHRAIVTKNMTVRHGPIQQGLCTPCHDPHAGAYPRLVAAEFPAGFYAPYTEQEYALCFGCHKREMVQLPDTASATGFRDGERNLHFLHVNDKQKGRSCRACHAVHGSSSPKLIAESVPFGKWNLPIRFAKTETGGSCAPGCHRSLTYDRKNPARKPLSSSTTTKKTS
jgi:predicted CXXCH cytochrome family protein